MADDVLKTKSQRLEDCANPFAGISGKKEYPQALRQITNDEWQRAPLRLARAPAGRFIFSTFPA